MKSFFEKYKKVFKNINNFFHQSDFSILFLVLSSLIFRLFIANFGTLALDQTTFIAWSQNLQLGFKTFYNGWSDYLPGYLYILFILGKINSLLPGFQTIIYKLPAIFADILTGIIVYKIIKKTKYSKYAVLGSLLYLFNPAVFANSSLWGQADSLTALFSLFSIYIFPQNTLLSALSLSIGTLIKPQAAFIFAAVIYLFVKEKKSFANFISYIAVGLGVFVLGFIPFNNTDKNVVMFMLDRLSVSGGQYPYGSVNAFSLWAFQGFWKSDEITLYIGITAAVVSILTFTVLAFKNKLSQFTIASVSLLSTFMFMTRMHERHLLPALVFILVSAVEIPSFIVVYLVLSLTYLLNLSYSYYWITDNFKSIFSLDLIKVFVTLNLISLGFMFVAASKKVNFKFDFKNIFKKINIQKPFSKDVSDKKAKYILIAIIAFSLITRIYSLGLPKEKYFDEVYHAFTAGLMLHDDPKAWEWWNPHPEGFAYEWTHPPLAKLGMVLGMSIFGENAFGWRIVQALLGTASIFLVYQVAYQIFKDKKIALISSFALSLDGLFLVMNRIGMNDSYLLFFSLLSVLLFMKNNNFLSAIAFGLAISSKWSAIYLLPILFVSHFVFKKKISSSYLSFVFVPIIVYILSYSGMFATGHTWDQFIEVQKQMWWYHTNLRADHPYTSPAWSWPLLIRPIYLYDGNEINGQVARIYAFGNPAVFWFGLYSIILSFVISARERLKNLAFVVFSYLIFFLPWIASPRIMFFYHYTPSLPFLVIACGYVIRRFPKLIYPFFVIATILFIYFYPHWTGLRIPIWLDESYYWFSTWR